MALAIDVAAPDLSEAGHLALRQRAIDEGVHVVARYVCILHQYEICSGPSRGVGGVRRQCGDRIAYR